jgi:hypothetical protein
LVRAEALYRCMAPDCPIFCVNAAFDALTTDQLMPDPALQTLHVFSNVLDVRGFDQFKLFSKMLGPGRHHVVAVSHNRDFDGGSSRIRAIKAAVEDPKHGPKLAVRSSEIVEFVCGEGGKFPAISWVAQLDVSNE